jgi:hypothetical protein
MPLPLPNLDDRSYADLVAQAQALIPALDPRWTDRNPTDPGIALVELLAWLTEMAIYRVNQVPDANYLAFLKLLNGPGWSPTPGDLDGDIRRSVVTLREPYRAVTCADYVYLVTKIWPDVCADYMGSTGVGGPDTTIARAQCLPRRDIDRADLGSAPGHISLVAVPATIDERFDLGLGGDQPGQQSYSIPATRPGTIQVLAEWSDPRHYLQIGIQQVGQTGDQASRSGPSPLVVVYNITTTPVQFAARAAWSVTVTSTDGAPIAGMVHLSYRPLLSPTLEEGLWKFLDGRRLLTAHHHVVGPGYVTVNIGGTLYLSETAASTAVPGQAERALRAFFDPLLGGSDGAGWPFGRPVYLSEVYALLEGVDGVDHADVTLDTPDDWRKQYDDNKTTIVAITLLEYELVGVGEVSFQRQ